MQTQEDHSNPIPALNVDSLKVDLVVIQNTCSEKEDSNSENASSKLVKECSLNSETKDVHAIKYKMSKAKERCMTYFRSLHSHLQVLSKDDLKGTRIGTWIQRACMSIYWCYDTPASLGHRLISCKMDSGRSGNDTDADDVRDLDPIYDEEPMAKVQLTAECNIFAIGQQHTEQPEIIIEGRVDQYPETCQVKSPMLDSSPDNQTTEYSKQSLESENILLKKTVAQFQKDFSRMEAHCIALELKYQNQSLKSGQHGQILNETSNKAKIEKEIDVLETMNIELEHSVAKLHLQKRWFSLVKSSAVYEEITSSRFDLRWKTLTGKIFKTVGLRNSARNGLQKDELHQMTLSQNSSGLRPAVSVTKFIKQLRQLQRKMMIGFAYWSLKIAVLIREMEMNGKREKMPDKIELNTGREQSQQGVSNDVLSFCEWRTSEHGDSITSVVKKILRLEQETLSRRFFELPITGLDDGVAASFQRSRIHKPHAHTQAFKVNHSTSR
ncbi:hypothetical protein Tco_0795215 [Tanacetum coccineum]